MANYPRRNYRKRAPVRKAGKPKRKMAKRSSIVKTVKSVLAKQVETKVLQYSGTLSAHPITGATTPTIMSSQCMYLTPLGASIPAVIQGYPILGNGIGQDQRIGDQVKIKGHYVSFLLQANPYNVTFNPSPKAQLTTIWVVKPKVGAKGGLDVAGIQTGANAIFYENQSNSDSGMVGTLVDTIRKVDRDNYTVLYKKEFKVGFQGTMNSTNVVISNQNNDFKTFYRGQIKLKGYNWKIDRFDYLAQQPIYLFITTVNADGTASSVTEIPCTFTFNQSIYYTDM